MSSATTGELVPTRRGHFAVDPKAKALMLPPEPADARTKGEEQGGAGKGVASLQSNDPIEDAYQALAAASRDERERSNKFPLSSAEMNSAIMPEAASPDGTLTGMSIKVDSLEGASPEAGGSIANEGRRIETADTTFRSDVRNEWVDAVFGKDFFPLNNGGGGGMTDKADMGVRQGTGAAGISHYVTYGALLDPSQSDNAGGPPQTPNDRGPRDRPFLSTSIQSKAQSTPLYSPTLSGGGTLLASASLASLTPSACGGDLGGFGSGDGGGGKGDPFQTPSHANGEHRAARYTVDATPKTPGTQCSQFTPHQQRPKLGITVSRIPLGVYVRSVSLESEAYAAGISPGSILVDMNGMGMLGERSDRALERLWRYAGLFGAEKKGGERSNGSASKRDRASSIGQEDLDSSNKRKAPGPDLQMKKPVQLRLYKNGQTYKVLLLSGKPLAGIDWAPCGNFALVHRVAPNSLAATAGVRRGTLVVGVDGEGMRTLDHAGVAGLLKEKFARGESIRLSLGYTPAASRSGFREKEDKAQNGSSNQMTSVADGSPKDARANNTANSMRDVEVRSRPVEYGAVVDTFFACTGPGAMGSVDDFESLERRKGLPPRSMSASSLPNLGNAQSGMAEVAAYVGAGGIVPPGKILEAATSLARNISTGRRTSPESGKGFGPCPPLAPEVLLGECWNPLASLARSMAYAASGCCETEYLQNGGPFERLGANGEAPSTPMECMSVIEAVGSNAPSILGEATVSAEEVFDAHLLQLLGVAISPGMSATVEGGRRPSAMLMDIVIDVALNDINLCQRLFFVLRSFVASLEEQKLPHGFVGEQSALATRLCRYAQRRLSGRMFDKSAGVDGERHCSEGYPIERESTGASRTERMAQELSHLEIVASKSTESAEYPMQEPNVASPGAVVESSSVEDMPASHGSSRENYEQNSLALDSNDGSSATAKKKSKGKKILRMLKPKSLRGSKKPPSDQSTAAPSTVNGNSAAPNSKKSPKTPHKSFTFTYPFHKNQLQTIDAMPPALSISDAAGHNALTSISLSRKFENMAWILRQLDNSTAAIEKNLMKSFSQKFTDWALNPWSPSKESALASVTASFRTELQLMNFSSSSGAEASTAEARFPVLNPVDPTELLTSVDAEECFILPSAHFPLLLCFNSVSHPGSPKSPTQSRKGGRNDVLYRTTIDILGLESTLPQKANEAFAVQCAVAGVVQESGVSDASRRSQDSATYRWTTNNSLVFETRSNWGHPKAASLKLSTLSKLAGNPDEVDCRNDQTDLGCGFVDLCPLWKQAEERTANSSISTTKKIALFDSVEEFDQHGFIETLSQGDQSKGLELVLRITTTVVSFEEQPKKQKRLLLYKHGDDLRQELLAIQFIERCNQILLSSGLDLKLKTFSCQPVGSNTGFIEWVRGTVPLSELCKSSGSSEPGPAAGMDSRQNSKQEGVADGDIAEYAAALESDVLGPQSHRWFKYQSLPGLRQKMNGSAADNPIQDFLRSAAYDENAPFMVKKDVMANYVKSCAGYCVITYLLGVGDRHLDNILLHQNGHLLHCDYSFILGQDPKTYLPMRITEEMIRGFGGRDSDNFAMFTSFTGAAFLTLRRHNNLHSLLSHICNMIHANMGDLSINQPPEEAILAMRGRFRLDLSDDDALAYIEDVAEKSITSKMWRAVDVMHSLGKHF
ncbi:hypothetical protein ACHAXT_003497 [Thalassiosira profunda]